MKNEEKLHQAALKSPIVHDLLLDGVSAEGCVLQLVQHNDQLMTRLIELERLCPFKLRLPDGRTMMWRCPEELVPERTLDDI